MAEHQHFSNSESSDGLKNGLKSRHLTMISIAGVIGGALFVGSGNVIYSAGPAALIAYTLGGLLVLLIMRMLGEMAVLNPDSGSFSTYADRGIGRWAGFSIGWLYWSFWTLLMGWEAFVAGKILNSWFPFIPIWGYMLLVTVALVWINLRDVKNFGEFEFWFALIKVIAIVLFLVFGSLAVMHLWPWGDASMLGGGTTHLTAQGFMPNGFSSVITALLGVMFAYMGAEIVTVAAAETKDPAKEIRKAANSIVWRIILFYVGSMLITVCLIPHNNPLLKDPTWGTYSVALTALGIPEARHIVNFVVLTSVCSCFNSALYTCSRMVYSLSKRGDAPKSFGLTNRNNSPWVGVIFSSLFSFVAIYLTATESMNIYDVLMLATGTVSLYVYLAIAISQLKLRKKLEAEGQNIPFKMWLFPWLTYLVIIFIVGALITMIIEGTYFKEVVYTSVLALFIVGLGICAQKFNWGKASAKKEKAAQARINLSDNL
ncbi:amino acid permease [Acinetobacter lwoffii]|uniref:GABA permease n=2 Tax=Gammaproteobacteria TaxID=1236 RepID=A0ABN0Q043_ACILW|nr:MULTISPECIES: amino acid permease [Acinetobacter]ENU16790.1 GABA permease [Acinetobacter sp. CIP A162]ESJ96145.1 GABA permease [Acinetobacter lwoffii NCTC 5866 = CIP 64.10 = NIPH 512]QXB40358.1 amino acid permease [Acinetobacter lwoffii]SUU29954.1 gamma-aminobutyrate permease [Acinetobacter lwoffii]VFQ38678.1 gamma-aminobutyrate permease [Acinetobacter lwoffii]